MYLQFIKDSLQEYIQKIFPEVGFSDSFHLSKPPDSKLGHLRRSEYIMRLLPNGCFSLAPKLKIPIKDHIAAFCLN